MESPQLNFNCPASARREGKGKILRRYRLEYSQRRNGAKAVNPASAQRTQILSRIATYLHSRIVDCMKSQRRGFSFSKCELRVETGDALSSVAEG
jgi:hypothetical protein